MALAPLLKLNHTPLLLPRARYCSRWILFVVFVVTLKPDKSGALCVGGFQECRVIVSARFLRLVVLWWCGTREAAASAGIRRRDCVCSHDETGGGAVKWPAAKNQLVRVGVLITGWASRKCSAVPYMKTTFSEVHQRFTNEGEATKWRTMPTTFS